MKRLFIILALAGSSFFTSSYAAGPETSPAVKQSFQTTFTGAKEIHWEVVGLLYKASFVMDGEHRCAFYNSDGELMAVTQNMTSVKLPKTLQASLQTEREGFWITELFVVSVEGVDTYFVQMENADTTVVLKSAGAKKWNIYKASEK